jgi:membrane-bound serine protease (ClpP class)
MIDFIVSQAVLWSHDWGDVMFFVWALALSGLFLIYLEFFLPGAIMAIGGSILLIGSIFMFHMERPGFLSLTLYLLSLSAAVYMLVRFALWRIRSSADKGTVVLATDQEGFRASVFPKEVIGKSAKTTTDLKPSGQISIDDQLYQALSESGYIDKGCDVTVVGGQGSHLIVTERKNP